VRARHDASEGRPDADLYTDVGGRVTELYPQRIGDRSKSADETEHALQIDEIERSFRLAGLRAERDEVYRRARS
jgi:hypothetical protein